MTPRTWEILGYVTHETVAQIVDLSFLVRRDNTASRACDALEKNTVPVRTTRLNADLSQVMDRFLNKRGFSITLSFFYLAFVVESSATSTNSRSTRGFQEIQHQQF